MKRICIIGMLLALLPGIYSQEADQVFNNYVEYPLTAYDEIMLAGLPELSKEPVFKADLPASVDNSSLPYFREIYQQVSSECSQVSAIAYNFTYEMDRLRDVSASFEENQYPPHFPYTFMSTTYGYGVSYFHSFEILRVLGCPDVETYGGMSAGGSFRWMTGYDDYYKAMKNRIRKVYQIKVGTPEGLLILKHWLHNHLDGSEFGGIASFYSDAPWDPIELPEGTPEAGKHVIRSWGGNPCHAMVVCGYNDSIRWDYNYDGKYTNDIDINNDGIVDMRDWEIGGLLFADGWDGGINFADSGKCYMTYKTVADKIYEGGIWNNAVHVLDVKDLDTPLLTARITLKHTKRQFLRVQCGVSSDPGAEEPEHLMEFPVFNFQGGKQFMQGGYTLEENKTIEFGLDISPLLSYIEPGQAARIFLQVEERDPDNLADGNIVSFSVIDYSGIPTEFSWNGNNLPLNNNSFTYASVEYTTEIDKLHIPADSIPTAIVGQQYSHQMQCEGGTSPFRWYLLSHYQEINYQVEMDTTGVFVEPDDWEHGTITYPLPFSFTFYNEVYDTLYIHPDGFVMFTNTQNPWPYMWDNRLFIKSTKCIAPFACQELEFVPAYGHGIWVSETDQEMNIRWKGDIDSYTYSPLVEFGLSLHNNGELNFFYGSAFEGHRLGWSCGVSEGNKMNYYYPAIEDKDLVEAGDAVRLITSSLPRGLSLSEDGIYAGTPTEYFYELELLFCVEDDNQIRDYKKLKYSSTELGINEGGEQEIKLVEAYYPNPFNSQLTIRFAREIEDPVTCKVYSTSGALVKILSDNQLANTGNITWDGSDAGGSACPAGIYFIHCRSGEYFQLEKVIFTGR